MWRLCVCVCVAAAAAAALAPSRAGPGAATSFSNGMPVPLSLNGQGTCFNALTGQQTGDARPYMYPLQPHQQYFTITIPSFQGCRSVGASVSVCEASGGAAEVQLQGAARALVHRAGDTTAPARADILVFCG